MAPAVAECAPIYQEGEKVLCFYNDLWYESKVLKVRGQYSENEQSAYEYRIHYKGWKTSWDNWVPQDCLRKFTLENPELAANPRKGPTRKTASKPNSKRMNRSAWTKTSKARLELDLKRDRGEGRSPVLASARGTRREQNDGIEKKEDFFARASIRIDIPDLLNNLLFDDCVRVAQKRTLVPVPSKVHTNSILDSYLESESSKQDSEAGTLTEFVAFMKACFDEALGKILLYPFERKQFEETRKLWASGEHPEWQEKGPGDFYGAEHLCRLIVKLPELIAQGDKDAQSLARLKEEITNFATWLAKKSQKFFCTEYEEPSSDY